ncbi:hypothetical protein EGW08_013983 [Elysia chlorotica]|uniref:Uncharacterized protein n=1 Tax=Elysia chlorotica TaxID=188477 RepID=A0A3S0ZI33_ELYCH|nr:hypothetical protein EGW08_013983 [Elysia chlorotica]
MNFFSSEDACNVFTYNQIHNTVFVKTLLLYNSILLAIYYTCKLFASLPRADYQRFYFSLFQHPLDFLRYEESQDIINLKCQQDLKIGLCNICMVYIMYVCSGLSHP